MLEKTNLGSARNMDDVQPDAGASSMKVNPNLPDRGIRTTKYTVIPTKSGVNLKIGEGVFEYLFIYRHSSPGCLDDNTEKQLPILADYITGLFSAIRAANDYVKNNIKCSRPNCSKPNRYIVGRK